MERKKVSTFLHKCCGILLIRFCLWSEKKAKKEIENPYRCPNRAPKASWRGPARGGPISRAARSIISTRIFFKTTNQVLRKKRRKLFKTCLRPPGLNPDSERNTPKSCAPVPPERVPGRSEFGADFQTEIPLPPGLISAKFSAQINHIKPILRGAERPCRQSCRQSCHLGWRWRRGVVLSAIQVIFSPPTTPAPPSELHAFRIAGLPGNCWDPRP